MLYRKYFLTGLALAAAMSSVKHKDKQNEEFDSSDDDDSIFEDKDEDLKTKVYEILKVFDQNGDNTIDISDIENVYRCLLINITQEQLADIESQLTKTENSTISCDALVPRLLSQLQASDKAMNPPTFADLESAFHTILEQCPEGLTKESLTKLMTTRGEPLNETEMAEMISHLAIRKNKIIDWKAYCRDIQMTIEEKQKIDKQ